MTTQAAEKARGSFFKTYLLKEWPYLVLIVLSLIGFATTDISSIDSSKYWQFMVPVFCACCIFTQWSKPEQREMDKFDLVRTQLLHWGAVFLVIRLVYLPIVQQNLNLLITAMIIVLVLSLSTFLAGVYIGWRYCVVGVFLAASVVAASFVQEATMWMAFGAITLIVLSVLWARLRLKKVFAKDKA